MALTETKLADALYAGNEMLFEQLFKEYYERLCNYANSIINDMDESEEIVQSTFFNIWDKKATIGIRTSVKSYLYQAVHNQCLNNIKHNKVRQAHKEYYLYTADNTYDSPGDKMIGDELEQKIEEAIKSLPPQCQAVFRMSRFDNLTYPEISQKLGISVKTTENHMGKALRILREKLSNYLPLIFWLLLNNNDHLRLN